VIVFAYVLDVHGSPEPDHNEISDSNSVVPDMGGDAYERAEYVSD